MPVGAAALRLGDPGSGVARRGGAETGGMDRRPALQGRAVSQVGLFRCALRAWVPALGAAGGRPAVLRRSGSRHAVGAYLFFSELVSRVALRPEPVARGAGPKSSFEKKWVATRRGCVPVLLRARVAGGAGARARGAAGPKRRFEKKRVATRRGCLPVLLRTRVAGELRSTQPHHHYTRTVPTSPGATGGTGAMRRSSNCDTSRPAPARTERVSRSHRQPPVK